VEEKMHPIQEKERNLFLQKKHSSASNDRDARLSIFFIAANSSLA
jgi:hypothetical protein